MTKTELQGLRVIFESAQGFTETPTLEWMKYWGKKVIDVLNQAILDRTKVEETKAVFVVYTVESGTRYLMIITEERKLATQYAESAYLTRKGRCSVWIEEIPINTVAFGSRNEVWRCDPAWELQNDLRR